MDGRLLAALAGGASEIQLLPSGEFRAIDVEEAAAVVLALVDGLSLQLTFDRGLMTLPRAARAAETAIVRYLENGDPT